VRENEKRTLRVNENLETSYIRVVDNVDKMFGSDNMCETKIRADTEVQGMLCANNKHNRRTRKVK